MRKLLAVLLAVLATALTLTACETADAPETEKPTDSVTEAPETNAPAQKPEITAECVVKKGNRYVIVLPKSKHSIPVDRDFVKYLPYVSDELVAAAEAKITEDVEKIGGELEWTISEHENGKMCLMVEVIVFKEGADYMEEQGCGIDHDHFFFAEYIIEEQ